MESQFVKSREFTAKDIADRMKNPIKQVCFEVEFEDDDYRYEDTILLPIAMPRVAWKLLYGSSVSAKTTVQDVASEWLCDTAMDMIENMKELR
jgi:hypothetical protein